MIIFLIGFIASSHTPRYADRVRPRLRRLTGDIEPAQKHFLAWLEMEAPVELRGLARNGLREIAAGELKARGPRKDGGLLSGWARRLFRRKSLQEIREIAFEIGMLGQHAQDESDPRRRTSCGLLAGESDKQLSFHLFVL